VNILPPTPENSEKQADLKNRIRKSGFPIVEDYPTPEAVAKRIEADFWKIVPASECPITCRVRQGRGRQIDLQLPLRYVGIRLTV
jgi:hypothetical protein